MTNINPLFEFSNPMTNSIQIAQKVIKMQINALEAMVSRINSEFLAAVEIILSSKGHVVVLGNGEVWHYRQKNSRNICINRDARLLCTSWRSISWRSWND